MQRVLEALTRLALGLWIGSVACVSFIVAPRVFTFIEDNARAGELMSTVFPKVDYFGIGTAVLCLVTLRKYPLRAIIAGVLGGLAAVSVWAVLPKVVADGNDAEIYHKVAVWLWGAILIGGSALIVMGMRPYGHKT